jgi:hypothetical protein
MRCASVILACAFGLPLVTGALVAAFLGCISAFGWLAAQIGWSTTTGEMTGLALFISLLGAAMGAASCRRAA